MLVGAVAHLQDLLPRHRSGGDPAIDSLGRQEFGLQLLETLAVGAPAREIAKIKNRGGRVRLVAIVEYAKVYVYICIYLPLYLPNYLTTYVYSQYRYSHPQKIERDRVMAILLF